MPQAVLGSRAYPLPPEALRALSPELYDYLTLLHVRLFGAPAGATDTSTRVGLGDLDETNINGALTDTTDHSLLTNLDADNHAQYLDTTRHAAVSGNPHGVTAADVGNTTAQWNADQLQGESLSTTTPAEGQVLTYTAGQWEPEANLAGLQSASVVLVLSGSQSTAVGLVPAASLIWGVFAEEVIAVQGPATYDIGTATDTDLWAGAVSGPTTDIDDFTLLNPFYVVSATDVVVTATSGTFTAGSLRLTAYYWQKP